MLTRRLAGLALISVSAAGIHGVVAPSAGALTGVSLLPGDKFPISFTASNKGGRLKWAGGEVQCTAELAEGTLESATLGKATDLITGCKFGAISCASETAKGEKDAKETILVVNIKGVAVSLLSESKVLSPGVANLLTETLLVNCGGVKVSIKGSTMGVGIVSSLIEDITSGTLRSAGKAYTCELEKEVCEKLAKEPLLINTGSGFEPAETELEGTITTKSMVVLND